MNLIPEIHNTLTQPSLSTFSLPGLGRGMPGLYPAPVPALGAGHELVEASLAAGEHGAAGAGVATVSRALQCEDIIILLVRRPLLINGWVHFTAVNIPG